ncbi:MAG: rRNA maturation RNase YbeY [Candidatus Niyogibacteria bacterium]|nr:MAG: rRNA maturation RNase YbeY [Candidatus Niyogibacteria bacterium]
MTAFAVKNLTVKTLPELPWQKIKNKILFSRYDLSLVFTGDKEMTRINRRYRRKNGPTNVLAFALGKNSGEIFIDLPFVRREAKKSARTQRSHVLLVYIHALLHLKGFKHDTPKQLKIMNQAEQKWLKILS